MPLYSCRHSGDLYRITKFTTPDFNVESSYLCDATGCDCPAGHRPTCRHREMLPKFLAREAVGTSWLYDYDRGGWVQSGIEVDGLFIPAEPEPPLAAAGQNHSSPEPSLEISPLTTEQWREGIGHATIEIASAASVTPAEPLPSLPEGVQMFILSQDNIAEVHNAIADAVGEPEAKLPSPRTTIRRRV